MKNLAPIHAVIPKGSLDSTSTSTVMTATVPGIDALFNGVCVWLTNGVITSASNFTININGLGAKPVYSSQSAASRATTLFNANYTALLIYNETRVSGGCWDYVYGYDSNTNTIGYQIRTQAVSMPMDSITYRYRLLFQSSDGKKFVPANNSTSTNATAKRDVIQTQIDPFGLIIYYGTTASVAAGSNPNSSYLWQQYNGIALGYSFNRTGAALTLNASKPVYLKCAPQSNGMAIIDSETPIVQSLPSSEDGKIYIFLGITESATAFALTLEHPIYEYKNGYVRQWTNAYSSGAVTSVNGQTGAVSLTASDVGALPDTYTAPVTSVNTKTGAVSLSASDVGALPDDTLYVSSFNGSTGAVTYTAPVTSVNGSTGAVTVAVPSASSATPKALGTAAAGSSTDYSRADHVHAKPTYSKSDVGLGNVDNVKQYSASNPPPYPVTSVNGSTGDVSISVPSASSATPEALGTAAAGTSSDYSRADHVHAKPTYSKSDIGLGNVDNVKQYSASNPPPYPVTSVNGSTGAVTIAVPTKTSDLTNDDGFITGIDSSDVTTALGYTPYNSTNPNNYVNASGAASAAPVQSVNNKTGAVSLSASDVGALASGTNVNNVLQTYAAASGYTYWRPLLVGASSGQAEGFTPSTKTDQVYTFSTIKVQPSSGTISANFKGSLTGTASGNLKSGDNVSSLTNDSGYVTGTSVVSSTSISNTGLISFKNSSGTTLFTVQLPLYQGGNL